MGNNFCSSLCGREDDKQPSTSSGQSGSKYQSDGKPLLGKMEKAVQIGVTESAALTEAETADPIIDSDNDVDASTSSRQKGAGYGSTSSSEPGIAGRFPRTKVVYKYTGASELSSTSLSAANGEDAKDADIVVEDDLRSKAPTRLAPTEDRQPLRSSEAGAETERSQLLAAQSRTDGSGIADAGLDEDVSDDSDMSDLSGADDDGDDAVDDTKMEIDHSDFPPYIKGTCEAIEVCHTGSREVSGEYRWFMPFSRWCMFTTTDSYCIAQKESVYKVYEQLKRTGRVGFTDFRWGPNIQFAYVIADIELNTIYYAAPLTEDNLIPNNEWIAVNGEEPCPLLKPGAHGSEYRSGSIIDKPQPPGMAAMVIPEGDSEDEDSLSDLD